jgi:surfactin family lipopeptide synthetase A/fengycin family lipopeptide synthetase D
MLAQYPPKTLVEALMRWPDGRVAVHFAESDGNLAVLTFGNLRRKALTCLAFLRLHGLRQQKVVLLCLNSPYDLLVAYWACCLGGFAPALLAAGKSEAAASRLQSVVKSVKPCCVLLDQDGVDFAGQVFERNGQEAPNMFAFETVKEYTGAPAEPVEVSPHDIALLQFSSGSTGAPKGVVLTHQNLLANISAIAHSMAMVETDVIVSWMPLFHDMGLIGFHFVPLVNGVEHILMRPEAFMRNPVRWLEWLSQVSATVTGTTSFGIKHLLRRWQARPVPGLDLDSLRVVFIGAEPISASLCREMLDKLATAGLRECALFPVYGLAEASLAVTFPALGSGIRTQCVNARSVGIGDRIQPLPKDHPSCTELVCVGRPVSSVETLVADDAGKRVCAGTVGRILIRGASVTRGYLGQAPLAHNEWLDTGDLGVELAEELYITGRLKEIFIQNGQKHHLSDLEAALSSLALLKDWNFALGVVQDTVCVEHLVAFVEDPAGKAPHTELLPTMRRVLFYRAGVELSKSVSIRRLPRTTSGKIQRTKLCELVAPVMSALPSQISSAKPLSSHLLETH